MRRHLSPLLFLPLAAGSFAQTSQCLYEVRLVLEWSDVSHPHAFPGNGVAGFSPFVGVTHDNSVEIWREGQLATSALERLVELGDDGPLRAEVDGWIAGGQARGPALFPGGAPDRIALVRQRVLVDEQFPLFSFAGGIQPSPDWFVGVDGLELLRDGYWDDVSAPLVARDAGTDSGTDFVSADDDTVPRDPIGLQVAPFLGFDSLGEITVQRIGLGTPYCSVVPNSTGTGGALDVFGSGSAGDTVTLVARALPPNQAGLFLVGSQPNAIQPVGSIGNLCVGGAIGRILPQGVSSDAQGRMRAVVDTSTLAIGGGVVAVQPGETWHFQAWHRDAPGTSNFTRAVAQTF